MKIFGKKEIVIAVVMMVMLGACNSKTTEEETNTSSPTTQTIEDTSVNDGVTGGTSTVMTGSTTTSSGGTTTSNGDSGSSTGNTNTTQSNTSTSSNDNNTSTGSDTNSTTGGDDNTTTTPTITLKSLTLTINKTTLNKDENTTVKIMATYSDNSIKEVTNIVEWIITPSDSIKVEKTTLTALKDKNTSIKAKLNNTLSNEIALNITWVANGHTLPPEPDKTLNDSTLLGIDTNNNGVRDDVERWIYETYKDKHPIHIDIAMQEGRANKLILEHPERAKSIHNEVDKAVHCQSYYKYYAEYFNEPNLIQENSIDEYFRSKIYFNTQERMDAYDEYDTLLSGDSYTLPKIEKLKAMCDFNTSKY